MEELTCLRMARDMLGLASTHELPAGLRELLVEADELCGKLRGAVLSRQIVALTIAMYRRNSVCAVDVGADVKKGAL